MAINVHFSTPLLKSTDNNSEISLKGDTVKEVNDLICKRFPNFHSVLYDMEGKISKVINIYVNDNDIRTLEGENTSVNDGDEVYFIPTISGG